jgi:hypothetical protein
MMPLAIDLEELAEVLPDPGCLRLWIGLFAMLFAAAILAGVRAHLARSPVERILYRAGR